MRVVLFCSVFAVSRVLESDDSSDDVPLSALTQTQKAAQASAPRVRAASCAKRCFVCFLCGVCGVWRVSSEPRAAARRWSVVGDVGLRSAANAGVIECSQYAVVDERGVVDAACDVACRRRQTGTDEERASGRRETVGGVGGGSGDDDVAQTERRGEADRSQAGEKRLCNQEGARRRL